jgi:glutamate 5-kinase
MKIKRIVIKIGSSLLVEGGNLRPSWLEAMLKNVFSLLESGVEVILVSSGAIALGKKSFDDDISSIAKKQAAAAVGQISLMAAYREIAKKNGFDVAQILVSASDFIDRERYDNLQNVFSKLLENKIVPIINENDSVAIDEIRIGDNDRLAARIAQIIGSDLLILFSDIDGLYDKNPKTNNDAKLIEKVDKITKEIEEMASGAVLGGVGTGGMATKIVAAKMALLAGCDVVITDGRQENALADFFANKKKYTIFKAQNDTVKMRKKFLTGFLNAKGEVIVNKCAKEVLAREKISLLPIGIIAAFGDFKEGDLIFVKDEKGNHLASGIANYDIKLVKKVLLKQGDEVKKILGLNKVELIHIDNLVVW